MGKYSDFFASVEQQSEQPDTYLDIDKPLQSQTEPTPKAQPTQTPEEEPGILSDAASMYGIGSGQLVKAAGWLFDSETLSDVGQSTVDYWENELSAAQKEASQKRFVNDDYTLGEGASDPRTWMGTVVQSLPMMVPGIGAAGLGGRVALKAGMSKAAASATAAGAGSASEGVIIGSMVGEEVENTIMEAPLEELQNSPYFQDLTKAGKDPDEARQLVAEKAAQGAGLKSGVLGALLGVTFNKFVGDAVTGRLSKRLAAETSKGAAEGAATEIAQTGVEAYARQSAFNEELGRAYDPAAAANEIVGGAGAGGIMGGGVGFAGGVGGSDKKPLSEEAIEAREKAKAEGADDLDATRAATDAMIRGLSDPAPFDQPLGDIGDLTQGAGLMTDAENEQRAQRIASLERQVETAITEPEREAARNELATITGATPPKRYDSPVSQSSIMPEQPLSAQVGTDVNTDGPQVVYEQDGVRVTQSDQGFEAQTQTDNGPITAFGKDPGEARRKLTQLVERNKPQAPVLQPRDRSIPGYVQQTEQIADAPDYDQVSASKTAESGAPMVFPQGNAPQVPDADQGRSETITMSDGAGGTRKIAARYAVVEADQLKASHQADGTANEDYGKDGIIALNNGRTAGLQEAYNRGTAEPYREAMQNDAEALGIDPQAVAAKQKPVLVRLFDGAQLEGIDDPGSASNARLSADVSIPEQARTDARKLSPQILSEIQPGDPTGSGNADFVRRAVQALSAGETNTQMRDSTTGLLTSEGQKRIRGALIERAFTDETLTQELVESVDSDLKTLGDALAETAGRWALMREQAKQGAINPDMDITDALVSAVNMIRKSRQDGQSLKDSAGQIDAFAGEADQMAVHILSLFYRGANFGRIRNKDAIAGALNNYIETALQSSPEPDMFGEIMQPQEVLSRERDGAETDTQEPARGVQRNGPDNRSTGPEGEGRIRGAGRAEDAEGLGGETQNVTPELDPITSAPEVETATNKKADTIKTDEQAGPSSGFAARMEAYAKEQDAIADDWGSRQYKKSDQSIDLEGDGPKNSESVSVNSINEKRRRRRVNDALRNAKIARELASKDPKSLLNQYMEIHGRVQGWSTQGISFEKNLIGELNKKMAGEKNTLVSKNTIGGMLMDVLEPMRKAEQKRRDDAKAKREAEEAREQAEFEAEQKRREALTDEERRAEDEQMGEELLERFLTPPNGDIESRIESRIDSLSNDIFPDDGVRASQAIYSANVTGLDAVIEGFKMGAPEKAAFLKFLRGRQDANAILDRLENLSGTPWAKQAILGALSRQAMIDLIAGVEPDYQSPLTRGAKTPIADAIRKFGAEGIWKYLQAKDIIGHPEKPVNAVNGSFIDCNPSKQCAKYCYATKGHYNYANSINKSELVSWAVESEPKRAAKMVAREYKATAEFEANKALRLFDKGDLSEAWAPFIKDLNKQGIRVQVFSKNPDALRKVDPMNLRMLSIDESNLEMAEANPDLEVAFVYNGTAAMTDWVLNNAERIAVILPIKQGQRTLKSDELTRLKANKKTRARLCPIDTGTKKLGDWDCLKCDKNGGVGCFHGNVTKKVLEAATKGVDSESDVAKLLQEIENEADKLEGDQRAELLGSLDSLLSKIRSGTDTLAAVQDPQPSSGAVQVEADGSQRTDGSGDSTGRLNAPRRGYQAAGQADLFADPDDLNSYKQVDAYDNADERPGTTEAQRDEGRSALRDLLRQLNARYRRTGRLSQEGSGISLLGASIYKNFKEGKPNRLIGQTVQTPQDLAALAQVYRDPRFETFRFVLTRKGKVVAEQAVTSRLPSMVKFDDKIVPDLRNLMDVWGADGYYMMHNHPSGKSKPSDSDIRTTINIANTVPGFQSHVVIDFNEFSTIADDGFNELVQDKSLGSEDFWNDPDQPNDLLGFKIKGPDEVAQLAKKLQEPDRVVFIGANTKNEVTLLTSLPKDLIEELSTFDENQKESLATLRRMKRASGSGGYGFLVVQSRADARRLSRLVDQGVVIDVVAPDGSSAQNMRLAKYPGDAIESGGVKSMRVGSSQEAYTPQTDTPAFRKWFGDSKVVNENGEPLVVYKGMYPYDWTQETTTDPGPEVSVINRPEPFPAFNGDEAGVEIAGFFGDRETASGFAERGGQGAVYPAYLSIENPLVIDADGKKAGAVQFGESGREFRDGVRSGQYDGAIIENTADEATIYVAFRPEQIKSATGNSGTFDSNNPDIRFRQAPDAQPESLTATEARTHANTLMRDWKGRPPVTVANSISEFPKRLRDAIRKAGAESDMRAVFFDEQVYILAPRIPNTQALEEVILHEVVGHYGLRKMVGKELKPLLNRVYMDMGKTEKAEALKKVYFPGGNFDPKNMEHRLTIAEEMLAHLAESGKQRHRTLWQRIVTAIRDGLRRLGFTINMNDTDLLNILAGAQKTVEQGGFSRPSEADTYFRRAYHGTPHRFDKFSLEAMGTGEGAQAYGWGLYFAGNRGVAEYYQKILSAGKGLNVPRVRPLSQAPSRQERDAVNKAEQTFNRVLEVYSKSKQRHVSWAGNLMNLYNYQNDLGDLDAKYYEQNRAAIEQEIEAAEATVKNKNPDWDEVKIQNALDSMGFYDKRAPFRTAYAEALKTLPAQERGNLYEVEIPDDSDLLDWDAPLDQQPESVQMALRKLPGESYRVISANDYGGNPPTGSMIYNRLQEYFSAGRRNDVFSNQADFGAKDASQELSDIGIPGLRYLDGSSRNQGEGNHNYVIWDESVVSVQAVNDEIAQAEAYFSRKQSPVIQAASRFFEKQSEQLLRKAQFVYRQKITDRLAAYDRNDTGGDQSLSEIWLDYRDQLESTARDEADATDLTFSELEARYKQDIQKALDAEGGKKVSASDLVDYAGSLSGEVDAFLEALSEERSEIAFKAKSALSGMAKSEASYSRTGQANTEAFREWFGSEGIVDESGAPMVVYHGTKSDFTEFQATGVRRTSAGGQSGKGRISLTTNPEVASRYATEIGVSNTAPKMMSRAELVDRLESLGLNDIARHAEQHFMPGNKQHLAMYLANDYTGGNVMPVYVRGKVKTVDASKAFPQGETGFGWFTRQENKAKKEGFDVVKFENVPEQWFPDDGDKITVFDPSNIKSAIGNSGAFDPANPDIRFSRMGNRLDAAATHFSDLTDDQRAALGKIAPRTPKERAQDWLKERTDRWQLKVRQGAVDRFAALADVDMAVHGRDVIEDSTASSSWVLAQMSGSASGALQSMLTTSRIKLNHRQKVITTQDGTRGLNDTLKELGSAAEIERFFGWIAGNRSRRLMAEGRENLFEPEEVEALAQLNRGTTDSGQNRLDLYRNVFREFQQYRDDVLGIAEQAGIITAEQRETWANEFYVPFYRLAEDDGDFTGPKASGGISRQEAYKKLKGGSRPLNDLLENTMMNFHHLLQASLKNQAAIQAMDNSQEMGIARQVREADRDTENSTFILENGQKTWYEIDDPMVFKAVTALAHPGMNSSAMKIMRGFKRLFTNLTTTTPQFVIANLLRDSMQAAATSEVSKNILKNMAQGSKVYGDPKMRAKMMASGGSFSFGHLYGENADELRLRITGGLAQADILRSPSMIPNAVSGMWRKWNEMTEFTENINRAAIFEQNLQERGDLYAAFKSRDLMNFSQHGAWPAMRVLIDVVPFLNARLQGLDKIYRSGVNPGLRTVMGKGTATEKQAAMRFWSVTGALALATIALYLNNRDDEEYKKLEEWQKDTYWFFRVSDDHAIFIPKPFEVGAIATLAERLTEQAVSDTATGELFADRLSHMLLDTFSFSPVPQAFQPALDIYSNYDAFTGRPIESMGMERLSPSLRRRNNTTSLATGLSSGLESAFGSDGRMTLSPVQIDHAIQGYFGSVGSWVAGVADTVWRTASGETAPAKHWYENQPVRRFYKSLGDEDRYTRYGTVFYEALKETNRVYADIKEYMEIGDLESARETYKANRQALAYRRLLNKAQRKLSEINSAMQSIRRMDASSEYKRRELDRLRGIKNRIQEALGRQIENSNASL